MTEFAKEDLYWDISNADLSNLEKQVLKCIYYFDRSVAQTKTLCSLKSESQVKKILKKSIGKLKDGVD